MRRPYVIIGNSTAALGCIEAIRATDGEKPITLVAKEQDPIYSRPMISHWLAGHVSDAEMYPMGADFYERANVEAMLGAEVVSIDAPAHSARLADGTTLEFDQLLIAGGGRPIIPPEPDATGLDRVSTFTCWQDARRVRAWVDEGGISSAVVVGGGLIGMAAGEALAEIGIAPTIVELSDHIMAVALDAPAGQMARAALERKGIGVCCGVTMQDVRRSEGRVAGVTLSDGTDIPCQLLLFAIGVRPNTAFLEGSGLEIDRGIRVDDHMQTSVTGLYAAGDIAQGLDRLSGQARTIPILRNARQQGRVAGANMAGLDEVFRGGVAMNSTDIAGLPCISIGLANPPGEDGLEIIHRGGPGCDDYRKLVFRGSRLVGAICVGAIKRAGVLRHLIEEGIDVTPCRGLLLEDDFPLEVLPLAYWTSGRVMTW